MINLLNPQSKERLSLTIQKSLLLKKQNIKAALTGEKMTPHFD